eukprot:400502_1
MIVFQSKEQTIRKQHSKINTLVKNCRKQFNTLQWEIKYNATLQNMHILTFRKQFQNSAKNDVEQMPNIQQTFVSILRESKVDSELKMDSTSENRNNQLNGVKESENKLQKNERSDVTEWCKMHNFDDIETVGYICDDSIVVIGHIIE